MTPLAHALPFVALLPLAGASFRRPGVFAGAALGGAILAGLAGGGLVPAGVIVAQLPALFVSVVVALLFTRPAPLDGAVVDAGDALETRRNELRNAVADAERQEARALQIYGTAKSLAGSLSWEDMGPRLGNAVQRLFGSFEYVLFARDGERLTLLQRRGTWKREAPPEAVPVAAVVLSAAAAGEAVPVLVAPIHGAADGLLCVKIGADSSRNAELIDTAVELGPQLGMALSKALLFRQLETQSRTDGLTGVLRRQVFVDRMAEEFKRAAVFHTEFSVLMIDIDHFKVVNDSHGHPAGDAVLARIGKVLGESFYETDVVARYGGEEFIVLLPRSELEGVMRKAEALRRRIESERITAGFSQLQVTVSIGVAHYPAGGKTPEELVGCADKALYRAKESGRNRVVGA